jgi:hypothetical protein
MKSIKEILAERQATLFAGPEEKGSREWSTFNVVRGDTIGAYRVTLPHRPVVVREPHHVLRIVYPHFRPAH